MADKGKRKAVSAAASKAGGSGSEPASKKAHVAADSSLVNPGRVRTLKDGTVAAGPVIYWMTRDQRMADNWALLYAMEQAQKTGSPVAVAFNVVTQYLNAGARQFGFMLRGLKEMVPKLADKNIAFFLLQGDPTVTVPALVADTGAALLVTDYGPLRIARHWRTEVGAKLPASVPFHEVDAHNVVPQWVASDKRETGARTLRPKIHRHLPEFLRDYPALPAAPSSWPSNNPRQPAAPAALTKAWDALISEALERGKDVPEVTWCKPGEAAAADALAAFLSQARLSAYGSKRNDPTADALSGLSPYLHFGQLAPQRAALAAAVHRSKHKEAVESFLEELVVRRELADNFCHFSADTYDNIGCAAVWARESLDKHRPDKREYIYTREQLEKAQTHDELWNASQLEMVHFGKMHGFMRMYWAKKILEWTNGPEEAMEVAIYLNDKYEIDGRDPNGYTGIAWSMVGVHDQGWGERAVFGKIRYMNYAGCKRKFDIVKYVANVTKMVTEDKKRIGAAGGSGGGASGSGSGGAGGSKATGSGALRKK